MQRKHDKNVIENMISKYDIEEWYHSMISYDDIKI